MPRQIKTHPIHKTNWFNLISTQNQSFTDNPSDIYESPILMKQQGASPPARASRTSSLWVIGSPSALPQRSPNHPNKKQRIFCIDSNRRILDFNKFWWTQNVQHEATGTIRSVSRVVDKYNAHPPILHIN